MSAQSFPASLVHSSLFSKTERVRSKTAKEHSPSFSLRLQKSEDVVKPDGTLDVSDDRSVGLVHEFDSDLGNTSSRSGSAEDLDKSVLAPHISSDP